MKLSGNTIFITGGGSGIGRGLAEAFHKQDNQVIISGRRRGHLDQVLAANPGMAAIELDIVNPASIDRAAAQLTRDYPSRTKPRGGSTTSCWSTPSQPTSWARSA